MIEGEHDRLFRLGAKDLCQPVFDPPVEVPAAFEVKAIGTLGRADTAVFSALNTIVVWHNESGGVEGYEMMFAYFEPDSTRVPLQVNPVADACRIIDMLHNPSFR